MGGRSSRRAQPAPAMTTTTIPIYKPSYYSPAPSPYQYYGRRPVCPGRQPHRYPMGPAFQHYY